MLPTIAQVCSLNSPFDRDIEDYAAGHCPAIEIWLGKLETYLETHSIEDVRRLLDENQMAAPVASYQGGLLTSQGQQRSEHWSHFSRRLQLCREIGIGTIVVALDIQAPLDQQTLDRAGTSLGEAAALAGKHDVRVAAEFQAGSVFGNNLQTAAAIVADVASPHLGICLDLFHFYCGPSKLEDLVSVSTGNLFHVQLCDLAGVSRELATDGERILPGDGDLPVASIVQHLQEINYEGSVSVELMNPQIWQIPARQFGEIAVTALRSALGLARMQ